MRTSPATCESTALIQSLECCASRLMQCSSFYQRLESLSGNEPSGKLLHHVSVSSILGMANSDRRPDHRQDNIDIDYGTSDANRGPATGSREQGRLRFLYAQSERDIEERSQHQHM